MAEEGNLEFSQLFATYHDRVYRIVLRLTGNPADAEELVQRGRLLAVDERADQVLAVQFDLQPAAFPRTLGQAHRSGPAWPGGWGPEEVPPI